MLSLSNSWGKYRTQTPIKSCVTSVAATVQITVLLAIKIFFFSITPKYVPKMFFNLLFHNKAGTCLCSRSMAGGRKGNFLMFAQQTRLKLQPPRKNSSVSSIRAMQKPAGTAAAHPQKEEHIIHESYGTQGHNTPSQGISLLPKAGKRYQLHLTPHTEGTETPGLRTGSVQGPRHRTFELMPSTWSFGILDAPSPHFHLGLFSLFLPQFAVCSPSSHPPASSFPPPHS